MSFDEIVELVRRAHERTADARVQTYRVVLAERRVRDQLRLLDRRGSGHDPSVQPPDLGETSSASDGTPRRTSAVANPAKRDLTVLEQSAHDVAEDVNEASSATCDDVADGLADCTKLAG